MQEYASAEFVLSDNNLRAQLEKIEAETGKRPAQLDSGGDRPIEFDHVWNWFVELSASRVEYSPLSHAELYSFFKLYDIEPLSVEVAALKVLDREWLLHKANTLKK